MYSVRQCSGLEGTNRKKDRVLPKAAYNQIYWKEGTSLIRDIQACSQLVGASSRSHRAAGSISDQGTCLGCRFYLRSGLRCVQAPGPGTDPHPGAPKGCFSLILSPFLFLKAMRKKCPQVRIKKERERDKDPGFIIS